MQRKENTHTWSLEEVIDGEDGITLANPFPRELPPAGQECPSPLSPASSSDI